MEKMVKTEINMKDFFILEPETARYQEMKLTIKEDGEIRLSTSLQREINSREIELYFHKSDCGEVYLKPNGSRPQKFTKAGTVKNRKIVEYLKKTKAAFPVAYSVKQCEEGRIWHGTIKDNEP